MKALPKRMRYNEGIVNEGDIVGRGCCRAALKAKSPRLPFGTSNYPIMTKLEKEYDLYDQLNLKDGFFYLNKKDQTRNCIVMVEIEMIIQVLSKSFFGISELYIAEIASRVYDNGALISRRVSEIKGRYVSVENPPESPEVGVTDHRLKYSRDIYNVSPTSKLDIVINNDKPTPGVQTFDILIFNATITDLSVTGG